jgi:hypothetical protein
MTTKFELSFDQLNEIVEAVTARSVGAFINTDWVLELAGSIEECGLLRPPIKSTLRKRELVVDGRHRLCALLSLAAAEVVEFEDFGAWLALALDEMIATFEHVPMSPAQIGAANSVLHRRPSQQVAEALAVGCKSSSARKIAKSLGVSKSTAAAVCALWSGATKAEKVLLLRGKSVGAVEALRLPEKQKSTVTPHLVDIRLPAQADVEDGAVGELAAEISVAAEKLISGPLTKRQEKAHNEAGETGDGMAWVSARVVVGYGFVVANKAEAIALAMLETLSASGDAVSTSRVKEAYLTLEKGQRHTSLVVISVDADAPAEWWMFFH